MTGQDQVYGKIPTRSLGRTGVQVSILGVGGYHIGAAGSQLGVRIVREAIDAGLNFLDNAWCYSNGRSEEVMGLALRDGYRNKVFLMTKNHGRDAETFRRQLHDIHSADAPRQILRGRILDAVIEARQKELLAQAGPHATKGHLERYK